MGELPVLDLTVVNAIKKLMENIENDINPGNSMDDIADLVHDQKLSRRVIYIPLLRSICDLLRKKGYPATANLFIKHWRLETNEKE
ncbi:MAG: hypothetical protein L6290_08380 [Thermodesulfovibrionales bacterium]|nr:hypothetical protein [Thermodesulfovibrionales bacterium]